MSIDFVSNNCCGCRTCKTVCKFNAISIVIDKYGFEQMAVDTNKCIECGMCETVCPMLHVESKSERHSCGAAYALDDNIKFQGSSGGLFGVFARRIILDGGCVYGAAFDDNLKLKTTSAETLDELVPLYKSKYLLCDTDDKFIEIQSRLDNGEKVLYCSSPCQIAALKLYLKRNYENLLTVEFVCHGVGSQSLFDKSIEYSAKKLSARIKRVIFRYKNKKASSHYYLYECENNAGKFNKQDLYLSFPYYNAYCKQLVCREGCYNCKYATEERGADITIGDFHTIEKYDISIDRFAGVSMFVCNSLSGETFLNSVKEDLFIKSFDWDILKVNNRFHSEGNKPKEQHQFMESIATETFEETVKKYLKPIRDWKRLIYYKSPSFLRNIAKKFGR
jgi:coenzyme F420-reducing hydrogenase beta subunit